MLDSTIIDVAIGVVLIFLGVSLATSAITEAISTMLQWREATLLQGIKQMVNDEQASGIALDLYNHALVNPLSSVLASSVSQLQHKPAYIDAKDFALAFYDVVGMGNDPTSAIAKIADPQLRTVVETLWRAAEEDVAGFKAEIGRWFDHTMDRLSGWYKTRTQKVSFVVALVIAAALNTNVLYEGAQIWSRPVLIADIGTGALSKMGDASKTCTPQSIAASSAQKAFCDKLAGALDQMEAANLIGWGKGPRPDFSHTDVWFTALLSWILVAGSTLFGASFWFDILQRLTQLRGTGLVSKRMDGTTAKPDIASQRTA